MGADGTGLNHCSGFKTSLGQPAQCCQSVCSRGIPAAIRPNHICFQVTLARHFTANWDSLWAFSSSVSFLGLFQSPYSFLGFVSLSQVRNGLPKITHVLSHDWARHRHQHPILDAGADWRILVLIPAVYVAWLGPSKTEVYMTYLIPNSWRICCTSSYRFPGSHMLRAVSLIGQSPSAG